MNDNIFETGSSGPFETEEIMEWVRKGMPLRALTEKPLSKTEAREMLSEPMTDEFVRAMENWIEDCWVFGSTLEMDEHPSFSVLYEMGERIVPLIYQYQEDKRENTQLYLSCQFLLEALGGTTWL